MSDQAPQRRLAAILAADVVGYSRLMGADEEGTLAQLKAHRRDLLDPKIAEHRGRIVKTTGDGLLAEFASVVDALRCAVEIQRSMAGLGYLLGPETREPKKQGLLSSSGSEIIPKNGTTLPRALQHLRCKRPFRAHDITEESENRRRTMTPRIRRLLDARDEITPAGKAHGTGEQP